MDTNASVTTSTTEALATLSPAAVNADTQLVTGEDLILREKMMFLLTIYPRLTPTMLHVGIGPQVRPQTWRPIMEALIREGKIKRTGISVHTPKGQYRTYTTLELSKPMTLEQWTELFRTRGTSSELADAITAEGVVDQL
jgi:hypothetical protein